MLYTDIDILYICIVYIYIHAICITLYNLAISLQYIYRVCPKKRDKGEVFVKCANCVMGVQVACFLNFQSDVVHRSCSKVDRH